MEELRKKPRHSKGAFVFFYLGILVCIEIIVAMVKEYLFTNDPLFAALSAAIILCAIMSVVFFHKKPQPGPFL